MATPDTRTVDGRTVVNRAWMAQRAGVSEETVKSWYRNANKTGRKPPARVTKLARVDYFDHDDFEDFLTKRAEAKESRITPADPDLFEGDEDDLIDINTAASWFHYASAAVIRTYLRLHPGYFPNPAPETVEGPSGKQILAFRRDDLIAFEQTRNGDNTGAAGRPAGSPSPTRGRRSLRVEYRIDTARQFLISIGGWRYGVASELAHREGEAVKPWERAVKEAREQIEREQMR